MKRAERTLEGLARSKPVFEEIRARMSERVLIISECRDVGEGIETGDARIRELRDRR